MTDMLAKLVSALAPRTRQAPPASLLGRRHNSLVWDTPSAGNAEGLDTSNGAVLNSSRG